jgi:PAS domain S-box-containing protein
MTQWSTNGTVHVEDLPRILPVFTQAIAAGDPYDFEARIRRFDGDYRWFQVRGLPLHDTSGHLIRWYVLLSNIDERKRAEDALRESERDSRMIVDGIPGFVALFGAAGGLEVANPQILEYTGRTLEELKQWETSDVVHGDDLPHVIEAFTRSIATGSPHDTVLRLRRFDGVYRWFRNRGFPVRDANGNIYRWCFLFTDIDDQKRAEDAIRASERNLQLIIDTIPALAWSTRPDGRGEFFNQHYVDFTGLSAEQASGWGWTRAVHPEDIDYVAARWQHILASGAPGEIEARLRRHDGASRWFLHRANPLRDDSGAIVKWYGVSTDIEDRKRAEQELRRSEARKAAILDSALDCIVTIDHEGRITEFNPAAERTFGCRRDEVLGQPLADVIIPPALRDRHRQGFARYLSTSEARVLGRRIEMTALRADGSEFPTELAITRIPLDGPPSFTGYLRDITERKLAEEELRRSEAFLAQAQRLTLTGSLWWKVSTGEITWSAESYRLMGYPTTIKPTVDLILNRVHPEDLSLVRATVDRSAREGANIDFEHRLLMPDGSVKHVHVVVQNVSGESGPPEFVGALSDITERKRVEAELRRAYDSFADAQRLSHTGSFITDLVGDDHNWSEETYRIFDFEPGTKVTVQRVERSSTPTTSRPSSP